MELSRFLYYITGRKFSDEKWKKIINLFYKYYIPGSDNFFIEEWGSDLPGYVLSRIEEYIIYEKDDNDVLPLIFGLFDTDLEKVKGITNELIEIIETARKDYLKVFGHIE